MKDGFEEFPEDYDIRTELTERPKPGEENPPPAEPTPDTDDLTFGE